MVELTYFEDGEFKTRTIEHEIEPHENATVQRLSEAYRNQNMTNRFVENEYDSEAIQKRLDAAKSAYSYQSGRVSLKPPPPPTSRNPSVGVR